MAIATVDASRRAQRASACSFDVFDTFLIRACTTPDGVFERTYELSHISASCPNVSESFVQHRIQAEARARRDARKRRGSGEVHISEIYSLFPFRLFGLDRSSRDELVGAEYRAEHELCRANYDMLQKYLEMKLAGHRVGFISDTYWNAEQLGALLRHCSPGLAWDFLYASCDNGASKSETLFATYLAEQVIDPAGSFHIGDNETADVRGARRHGIRPRYYPQASAGLAARLQRESAVFELFCPGRPSRLDHGSRTLRRMAAAQMAEKTPAFHLGSTVLGPVMTAFDAFVAARAAQLAQDGRRVAIGFLGRDGFLSHRIWRDLHGDAAAYLEINRRVTLIGSADTLKPLCEWLGKVTRIDAPTFADILKVLPPAVERFFATCPDGIATGAELADAMPELMDAREIAALSAGMRQRLLAYLREMIADFDGCTDLILVDIGYCGSMQKALRRIFDHEGIATRLHGAYLMTHDDAFDDLAEDDTAEGLISDLVVVPHLNRALGRNATVLEQICCAPEGSVRDYADNRPLREIDQRPAAQIALAAEIQSGALAFARAAAELAGRYRLEPLASPDIVARWSAAALGRLLLLPDDDELALLGSFVHDLNLGTDAMAPMLDGAFVRSQIIARGLPVACAAPAPPMWLAGSFATVSPSHAYLYLLFGANRLPANVYGEAPCGTLQVGLFTADGRSTMETVTVHHTGLADLRLRIPLSRSMAIATVALPLARVARQGLLHGVVMQSGDSVADAARSVEVQRIADAALVFAGLARDGRCYRAETDDGCLIIPVAPFDDEVAIVSVALSSLSHDRILTTTC
jgi:FMN phosphatase YigB (HAD superfamily)